MRMNLKISAALLLVGAMLLSVVSCETEKAKGREDAVAVILKDGSIDFFQQISKGIKDKCASAGIVPLIFTTENEYDIKSQVKAIESLSSCEYNIKGIIFVPIYYGEGANEAETALVKYLKTNNVPVVYLDTPPAEQSPLASICKAYVGTSIADAAEGMVNFLKDTPADEMVSVLYGTGATNFRYEYLKTKKGISDDDNAYIIDSSNELNGGILSGKLAEIPQGGTVVLYNGDLYDRILALGEEVKNFSDKKVFIFDAGRSTLTSLINGGQVIAIQAQNSFKYGENAVDAALNTTTEKEVLTPTFLITKDNLQSNEVKPFLEYFGL